MPSTSSISPTGDKYIDGILTGTKWATTNLTFSFPAQASFYGSGYGNGEPNNNFEVFNPAQQAAVRSILASYSAVANVTFSEVQETSSQHGDLRYAETDKSNTAWGYYPSTSATGGDTWFNNSRNYYDNPVKGNYGYFTIIHETGHALGLKHAHESMNSFGPVPADRDFVEYTVMSYRSYIGAPTDHYRNGSWDYPQTLMMYDIAALQTMYGANYTTNSGNSVYVWSPTTGEMFINGVAQGAPGSNKVFMTLWDGGGTDTYNFSGYDIDLTVSLQPGAWTTTSTQQLANLGDGHYATGNIANSLLYKSNPASLIENAIGGSGEDVITGNVADNAFTGGRGDDRINGLGGADTAIYSGNSSYYSYAQNADGSWTVADLRAGSPDGIDTLTSIQFLKFADITVDLGPSVAVITGTSGSDIIDATQTVAGQAMPCDEVDMIYGMAGNDTINAVGGDDQVYGGDGADTLYGGLGNDYLDGGVGVDKMFGGKGDDAFVVDNTGDVATESANEGTDTVFASVSFALAANIENLTLTGTASIAGTGNELANRVDGERLRKCAQWARGQ